MAKYKERRKLKNKKVHFEEQYECVIPVGLRIDICFNYYEEFVDSFRKGVKDVNL